MTRLREKKFKKADKIIVGRLKNVPLKIPPAYNYSMEHYIKYFDSLNRLVPVEYTFG